MRRRSFVTTCVSSYAATMTFAQAQPLSLDRATRAVAALKSARKVEVSGDIDRLSRSYHSDALVVEPSSLTPHIGRAAIVANVRSNTRQRKLLYLYYRQPHVIVVGNTALVISNYESGYESGGRIVEETGKSSNVVLLGPNPPLIALEVLVPNYYGGPSYGPLGTALIPHYGLFPLRALGPVSNTGATSAGGGENDVLFAQVRQINEAWVSGKADDLLKRSNRSGVFLIGDYSPFYVTGSEDLKEHFDDFYKTSKVNALRALEPTVRIWGDVAAVAFNFDLDYTINGRTRRSPGRGVYTFARRGAPNIPWAMAACAASHLVLRDIGDPYPTPVA